LTFTGNHVASDAYRISYAYASASDFTSAGTLNAKAATFIDGMDLPTVLETDNPDFRGLGHSATVLGPDMDSYYMAYHNLNSAGGPNRSLNIDRILFNGNQMSVSARPTGSIAPKLPRFNAASAADTEKFNVTTGRAISKEESGGVFTAEFNYKGAEQITVLVNYKDGENYDAVTVDLNAKTVALKSVVGGAETAKGSGTLVNSFDPAVLHTVRVAYRPDGKADVYFDNMRKIKDVALTGSGGKIGYLYTGTPELGYTAFSDAAGGLSDKIEIKQAETTIGASLYAQDEGSHKLTGSGGVTAVTSGAYESASMLKLGATGDYADYLVNFPESAYWGIEMTYPKAYAGKKIKISADIGADENSVFEVTLPDTAQSGATAVKSYLATLKIWQGIARFRIESDDGEVGFISFKFFKSTRVAPSFEHNLNTYVPRGSDYRTIWKLEGENGEGGHRAAAGTRQLVFIGDSSITDFTLEVELLLKGGSGTNTAGVIFRAGNYASSQHDNNDSLQGYYLSFRNAQAKLNKLNYAYSTQLAVNSTAYASDTYYKVKIEARGGNFKVYVAAASGQGFADYGAAVFNVNDALAFTHGRLGFYTDGAEACFRNLKITA
jgi:hypothetical protein